MLTWPFHPKSAPNSAAAAAASAAAAAEGTPLPARLLLDHLKPWPAAGRTPSPDVPQLPAAAPAENME